MKGTFVIALFLVAMFAVAYGKKHKGWIIFLVLGIIFIKIV